VTAMDGGNVENAGAIFGATAMDGGHSCASCARGICPSMDIRNVGNVIAMDCGMLETQGGFQPGAPSMRLT